MQVWRVVALSPRKDHKKEQQRKISLFKLTVLDRGKDACVQYRGDFTLLPASVHTAQHFIRRRLDSSFIGPVKHSAHEHFG